MMNEMAKTRARLTELKEEGARKDAEAANREVQRDRESARVLSGVKPRVAPARKAPLKRGKSADDDDSDDSENKYNFDLTLDAGM